MAAHSTSSSPWLSPAAGSSRQKETQPRRQRARGAYQALLAKGQAADCPVGKVFDADER